MERRRSERGNRGLSPFYACPRFMRMSNRTPRALSESEFLYRFRTVVKRLDTHLKLIDSGQYHMRDDLATILRTLLTRGKGDDGIRRFLTRFSLKPPKRDISPSANDGSKVVFAIGALPSTEKETAQSVTVPNQLMHAVPLFIRSKAGTHHATWENVVTDYGNTFGAHISTTVPVILDDVHFYGLSETDFGTYMLRSLGVLASSVCHELILQVDSSHIAVDHSVYFDGSQIIAAEYIFEDGKDILNASIRRENWKKEGAIMSIPSTEGKQIVFSIIDGGKLRLNITSVRLNSDMSKSKGSPISRPVSSE